jgi:hypothetical protein
MNFSSCLKEIVLTYKCIVSHCYLAVVNSKLNNLIMSLCYSDTFCNSYKLYGLNTIVYCGNYILDIDLIYTLKYILKVLNLYKYVCYTYTIKGKITIKGKFNIPIKGVLQGKSI